MNAFPEASRPIATCEASECSECPAGAAIHCHFQGRDLVHFYLICFPSFLVGGAGVWQAGLTPFLVWLGITVGFFGFLEIRVMCSHCPHYAEEGSTLRCWANYGSPKLWKYRPGPMSLPEKVLFFGGLAAVWGYPLVFMTLGQRWSVLVLYLLLMASFFTTLRQFLCSRCMNFACPLNLVPNTAREAFWRRNPVVAQAWGVGAHSPPPRTSSISSMTSSRTADRRPTSLE